MKLVSTVWVSTSLSKFGYLQVIYCDKGETTGEFIEIVDRLENYIVIAINIAEHIGMTEMDSTCLGDMERFDKEQIGVKEPIVNLLHYDN
jgi:hypothetical protein